MVRYNYLLVPHMMLPVVTVLHKKKMAMMVLHMKMKVLMVHYRKKIVTERYKLMKEKI
jgi:hypothetical protein